MKARPRCYSILVLSGWLLLVGWLSAGCGEKKGGAPNESPARDAEIADPSQSAGNRPAPGGGGPPDFSKSNAVGIVLGEVEQGTGMVHLGEQSDGRTMTANVDGVACRYLKREGRGDGYLYFVIDPAFKQQDVGRVRFEVEYLDVFSAGQPVRLGLQYDASDEGNRELRRRYARASGAAPMSNSGKWRVAIFRATDATLGNKQNDGADFRLSVVPPDLHVRRVAIVREK